MVFDAIKRLVGYAIGRKIIGPEDRIFATNSLLAILGLGEYEEPMTESEPTANDDLEQILGELCDYAADHGLLVADTTAGRDLFDTRLMAVFVDRPTNVIARFRELYAKGPKEATDWFYRYARDTDYIREYRIKKDLKWQTPTPYGDLDITINLSKPEKDPRDIAAAKLLKQSSYPKCQLCAENEGYAGRLDYPARETLRTIPLDFSGERYFLQYSPYSYFNEHCIVFNEKHIPMAVDHACFAHLMAFERLFPHYMLGSNADLPIVGGSILTHDHYQGGAYVFPMFRAPVVLPLAFKGFEDIGAGYVKWPLTDIRLQGRDPDRIVALADRILATWRNHTDKKAAIFAFTGKEPHSTITPIAHRVGDEYVLELVLRNNLTTKDYPLGLYHPHQELWHIKKENIGLIEVMGLAVLPARLNTELSLLEEQLVANIDPASRPETAKHAEWAIEIKKKHPALTAANVQAIVRQETGLVFAQCLEDAGVYKQTPEGEEGLARFVDHVNRLN